jgi:hypothetical protein
MSIINEALKKSGQPILTEVKEPAKRRPNWGPAFVLGVLLVITTPILVPLITNPAPDSAKRELAVGPDLSRPHQVKRQFGIEEAALPRAAQNVTTRFAMNGLVYSSDESYALINGKVLRTGDSVGGARLLEITPDGAVLEYRGQQIALPANA